MKQHFALILSVLFLNVSQAQQAAQRVALVIDNASYKEKSC
jgi:hypothetical protein